MVMPVEIISWLARPISLAIRLFANMVAGHALIMVFIGLQMTAMWLAKPLPLVGAVGLVYVEGVPKAMFGPEESVVGNCTGTFYRIRPGNEKKSDIAKMLSRQLGCELDQVQSVLPPEEMQVERIESKNV